MSAIIHGISRIGHAVVDPAARLFMPPKRDINDHKPISMDPKRVIEGVEKTFNELLDGINIEMNPKLKLLKIKRLKLETPKNQEDINARIIKTNTENYTENIERDENGLAHVEVKLPKKIFQRDPRIIHTCRKILGLTQKGVVKPALVLTSVLATAAIGVMIIMAIVAATVSSLLLVCSFIPATSSVAVVLEAIQGFISSYALWVGLGTVGLAALHLVTFAASVSGKRIDRKGLERLESWKRDRMITKLDDKIEALQNELQSHQISSDSSHQKDE